MFTATRWEREAVCLALEALEPRRIAGCPCVVGHRSNCRVWLFQTGIGPAKSKIFCRAVLAAKPFDHVLSCGFACALIPAQVGDLLIGTQVVYHGGQGERFEPASPLACSPAVTQAALEASERGGLPCRSGPFLTVPRVVSLARDKQELAAASGAIGLDMESASVAGAACERRIPFAIVRAASDLLEEDLPLDFNLFLKPAGWLRGLMACVSRPSSVKGLVRLRTQSHAASRSMTAFFKEFLPRLGQQAPN